MPFRQAATPQNRCNVAILMVIVGTGITNKSHNHHRGKSQYNQTFHNTRRRSSRRCTLPQNTPPPEPKTSPPYACASSTPRLVRPKRCRASAPKFIGTAPPSSPCDLNFCCCGPLPSGWGRGGPGGRWGWSSVQVPGTAQPQLDSSRSWFSPRLMRNQPPSPQYSPHELRTIQNLLRGGSAMRGGGFMP